VRHGQRDLAAEVLHGMPGRRSVERFLAFWPLGGQYAVAGTAGKEQAEGNHEIHETYENKGS
jgi:hypothetical protein